MGVARGGGGNKRGETAKSAFVGAEGADVMVAGGWVSRGLG